ncbi:MAG: efflux RND transporter periplasmic adaptor subunit [Acidobacteria bacterium]|nr:efflux RND transporter periplasmic adaptor subunit [Acidobacteriota bacterium]
MQQVFEARRQMVEARIGQAQADVVAARALVGYAHITSPLEGVVVTKSADVGSLAAPGVPLLTIEGGGSFQLEIALEQSKIAGILPGTPVRVKLEPPVDTYNVELSGKVAEVVPAADPKSRTFTVRVDLPGNLTLRSGLFGRALFAGGQRDTLLIPAGAVVTRGQLTSVYVVDAAGIVSLRLITLGRPTNGQVEVLSGLETEEKIVASASLISREGVQVR